LLHFTAVYIGTNGLSVVRTREQWVIKKKWKSNGNANVGRVKFLVVNL
jgi:hypothetical protein